MHNINFKNSHPYKGNFQLPRVCVYMYGALIT